MADKIAKIKVIIDPASFDDTKELNKSFSILQKKLNEYLAQNPLKAEISVKTAEGFNSVIETVKKQLDGISREVSIKIHNEELQKTVQDAQAEIKKITDVSSISIKINNDEFTTAVEKLANDFNTQFEKIGAKKALEPFKEATIAFANNMTAIVEKAIEVNIKTKEVNETIKTMSSQAYATDNALGKLSGGVDKFKGSLANIAKDETFDILKKGVDNLGQIMKTVIKKINNFNSDPKNKDNLKLSLYLDTDATAKNVSQQFSVVSTLLTQNYADKVIKLVGDLDVEKTAKNIGQTIPTTLATTLRDALKNIDVGEGVLRVLEQSNKNAEKKNSKAKKEEPKISETEIDSVIDKINKLETKLNDLPDKWKEAFEGEFSTEQMKNQVISLKDELIKVYDELNKIGATRIDWTALDKLVQTASSIQEETTPKESKNSKNKTTDKSTESPSISGDIASAVNSSIEKINKSASLRSIKLKFDSSDLRKEVEKAAKEIDVIVAEIAKAAAKAASSDANPKTPKKTNSKTPKETNPKDTEDTAGAKESTIGDATKQLERISAALQKAQTVVNSFDADSMKNLDIPDEYVKSYEALTSKVEKLSGVYNTLKSALVSGDLVSAQSALSGLNVSDELDVLKALSVAAKDAKNSIDEISAGAKEDIRLDNIRQELNSVLVGLEGVRNLLGDIEKFTVDASKYDPLEVLKAEAAARREAESAIPADAENRAKKVEEYVTNASEKAKEKINKDFKEVLENALSEIKKVAEELLVLDDVDLSNSKSEVDKLIKSFELLKQSISGGEVDLSNINSGFTSSKQIQKSEKQVNDLIVKLKKLQPYATDPEFKDAEPIEIEAQIRQLTEVLALIERIKTALANGDTSVFLDSYEAQNFNQIFSNVVDEASQYAAKLQRSRAELVQSRKELNKVQQEQGRINDYMSKYENRLKKYPTLWKEFQSLQNNITTRLSNKESIDSTWVKKEFDNLVVRARESGVEVENIFTKIWDRVGFNFRSAVASAGLMYLRSAFRDIYENVKNLDAAMTELKKVTDETDYAYEKFLNNAADRAQKLGASLVNVVSSTSDFARLGYSLSEATALSDAATIYLNVGDDVEDIDQSTKSLISTMQGFGIATSGVMNIVDEFNEVSNNYASSAGDIGEITQRSAAAMRAAGSSLEETIALGVTANTVVQDADIVGTALKTMSMRLRSSKTDMESAGEDAEGMADSVSQLRSEILALSGVDIMLDEETFKTPYQMLIEIGKVWDNLNDITRANITELLFGKRQANIGSAILQNVELAESILKTSQNSAGSALKENEIYLSSINGRLSQLDATWEVFSSDVLNSNLVKGAISFLNETLKVLDFIIDKLGVMPTLLGAIGSSWMASNNIKFTDFFKASSKTDMKKAASSWWSNTKGNSGFLVDQKGIDILMQYNRFVQEGALNADDFNNILKEASKCSEELSNHLKKLQDEGKFTSVEFKRIGSAGLVGASGIKGLGTAISVAAKQIGAAAVQFLLIQGAVLLIQHILEHIPTFSNLKKSAEESNSALQKTKSEIDGLNEQLHQTKSLINELTSKGHLTLTEQDELDRLREENKELERQLYLKRKSAAEDGKEAAGDTMKAIESGIEIVKRNKESYDRQVGLGGTTRMDRAALKIARDDMEANLEDLEEILSMADTSYFSPEQLREYNEILKEYAQIKVDLGEFTEMEALNFVIGDDEFQDFNDKLRQMSQTGEKVSGDLESYFGEDVANALKALGIEADDVNNHLLALSNLSDYLNNNPEIKDKVLDLAGNFDLGINVDSIKKTLGDELVGACEDAGYSIDTLLSYVDSLREAIGSEKITTATTDLEGAEKGLKAISEAFNEFSDNDGKVAASTLNSLSESLSSISNTPEYERFIQLLGDSKTSINELKEALNDLVDKYFDTQAVLGGLTYAQEDLYIAQLKQMGVSDAATLVGIKLAKATLLDASASDEAKAKTYAFIESLDAQEASLYNLSVASLTSAENLQLLKIKMELCKTGDFTGTINKNINAIISLGRAAGANGVILLEYAEILRQIADIQNSYANGSDVDKRMYAAKIQDLYRKAENIKAEAESQFNNIVNNVNTDVNFDPTKIGGTTKGSKDPNKDAYDKAKKKLDHQLEMNKISYETYYKKLVALGKKYFKKDSENRRAHYETLADVRRNAFNDYKDKLDRQLESNKISISSYYKKVDKLINKWYGGRKSNAEDYAEAELELQKQIADAWKNRISDQETQFERMTLSKVWPDGKSEFDYWKAQMEKLQSDYRKGIFKDREAYLEIYYDILAKMQDAEKALAEDNLENVTKRISGISDLVEMVSKMLKQRIEDEIDALDDLKDAYSDIVDKKKESLELTKEELSYQEEISDLNKDLTKLQSQAELLKLDTSRAGQAKYAEVMEQIREKQKDVAEKQRSHTYDATVDSLDKADEKYQEFIQKRIDSLNELMDNQGLWLEYVYNYIETTNPSSLLEQLMAYNYKYGDGINQTVTKIWDEYSKYADNVYGHTGYLSSILNELRNLELKYEKEKESADNESDSTPSDNYVSNLAQAVKRSNLKEKYGTNETAAEPLLQQLHDTYGGSWKYDTGNMNIYRNDLDNKYLISASAYPYITKMKSINNNEALSKSERYKQLDAQLTSLRKLYGYGAAHLVSGKNGKYHLYKTAGEKEKWQIFHDGIGAGYTGADYVPTVKQKELLALLKKGELVFNQKNQDHLLSQLQVANKFSEAFKGITPNTLSQYNYGGSPISLGDIQINIYGNANDDTIKKLHKEAENISNMTVDKINKALTQRGFNSGAAKGVFTR